MPLPCMHATIDASSHRRSLSHTALMIKVNGMGIE